MALLLDRQEGRSEFRAARGEKLSFSALLAQILDKPGVPAHLCQAAHRNLAAADLLALIRGMTDAAGERGEHDVGDLARRICAAVFGYLAAPPG